MSESKSGEVSLSERDRFWMEHHEAQVASGQSGKEYVAERDLSLDAVYRARKRLRAMGALPPARTGSRKPAETHERGGPVRFAKVAVSAPRIEASSLRVELANGITLEWSGVTEAAPIVELIERVRQLP